MHLSLSIVLAVSLIAGVQSQRPSDGPPGDRPFFDRPGPFGLRGLTLPQARLNRLFNRSNRPFRFGRPAFLNSEANGERLSPFDLTSLVGPASPSGPAGPAGPLRPRRPGPFRRDNSPPTVFSIFTTVPNEENAPTSL